MAKEHPFESIMIRNGTVITVDEKNRVIRNGAVFIENGRIVDIGKTEDVSKRNMGVEKVIDANNNLIIPGLINAHTHMTWYLTRGLGMDNHTRDWLRACIWPFLSALSPSEVYAGAVLGAIENLKTGTTFVIDNNMFTKNKKGLIDQVAQAAEDSGIRSIVLRGYHDYEFMIPNDFVEPLNEVVADYDRVIRKWHNKADGRIKTWLHPVNLLYSSGESLLKMKEIAEKHDIGIHTHVAEDIEGMKFIKERFDGKGYIDAFYDLGVLGPKFQMAHTIFVDDNEIERIAKTQARVMYTPTADMLLAAGAPPIEKMRKKGIVVALGTDSPNNSQDMVQCMKFAALLQKSDTKNSTIMPAHEALRLATIEGAKAIGMENELGSLEVGKRADVVVIDIHKPHNIPMLDPVSTLVYSSSGGDVDTVIVDGKIVVENAKLTMVDQEKILKDAQHASEQVIERAGIKYHNE